MPHPVPIGEYQEQVPVEEGLRRIIPSRTGVSVGPGLEDVGESLQSVAKSEAANYSLQTLSKAQSDWTQQLKDRQEQAAPGAPGFTTAVMGDYNKYVKDAVKNAPNAIAGRFLQQRLAEFGTHLANQSINFEAEARQSHNETVAKQAADSTAVEIQDNPSVFPQRLSERQAAIDTMNLEPQVREKLHQYTQQTLSHFAVMGDINRDPYAASLMINDPKAEGYYQNLTAEQRQSLLDHADRVLHQRVADAERVHSLAKQEQEDNSNKLLKQGIIMSTNGQLSASWVIGHSASLEPSAMKYLLDEASGKKIESDLHTYANLLDAVGRGQDVREDARNALFAGQLSKEDYTRITDKAASEVPNSYKKGIQYIQTGLKPGDLNPDPAHTLSLANAQNDFQDWYKNNPKATDDEVQTQAQNIVKRYQLVDTSQMMLGLHSPQFLVGTRTQPDIQATKKATVKALNDGQINRDEFNKQAALLQQWDRAFGIQQQKAAEKKKQQQ